MNKLSIVGAGLVGEAAAQIIARDELCRELVLMDVQGELAQGKALDVWQAAVESGSDTRVCGGAKAEMLEGSELVVITAGVPRKPGQSRQDVLSINLPILDGIMADIKQHAPAATVLVVSNPVDVLTYRAWSLSGLGRDKVFGQAGVLDTARMKCFIAEQTGFSARDITALVLGGHGDSMVPLMRYCQIGSVPLSHFLSNEQIEQIVERTRKGGGEILGLKKWAAPAMHQAWPLRRWWMPSPMGETAFCRQWPFWKGSTGARTLPWVCPVYLQRRGLRG